MKSSNNSEDNGTYKGSDSLTGIDPVQMIRNSKKVEDLNRSLPNAVKGLLMEVQKR